MRKILLYLSFLLFTPTLLAQKDALASAGHQYVSRESTNINLSIFPVPVRNNTFTIKTDRDISSVKITNIIGQDIYRIKFNTPQQLIKISLESPQRGMYLVTIIFSDGVRIVKKIMIEEPK